MMNCWNILSTIFAWAAIITSTVIWIGIPCAMVFMLLDVWLDGALSEKLRKMREKRRRE